MITASMVEEAYKQGLPELKQLFEKLPKEDCLKGIGIMVIMGIAIETIRVIKDIVISKPTQ